ncbi:hypothetical protein Vretimale_11084 [Volvox reticuliferus]|uniref:Uncharacterized protein n=1 Tax=Volvox reticuliferus TaxID=1737510 RepID=A0A8J4GFY6_9CHLO|nr:hypothetical protein Vretifemale_12818 [Volvox reticuliferus]GIM06860.1 hypothetical protein Vretimale_11084 [Volvox reticuliferus]
MHGLMMMVGPSRLLHVQNTSSSFKHHGLISGNNEAHEDAPPMHLLPQLIITITTIMATAIQPILQPDYPSTGGGVAFISILPTACKPPCSDPRVEVLHTGSDNNRVWPLA